MALAGVSNVSSWNLNSPVTFKTLSSAVPTQSSEIASSLPIISSSYFPSTPSASPSSGTAATSDSPSSVVPQSVLTALYSYVSPMQQAWNNLTQNLRLGDLASAQTALGDYIESLSAPSNSSMLEATTPSDTFLMDLKSVGDALATGSLADARTAFASANDHRPDTAAEAVSSAQSATEQDGLIAVYALEHPGSGAIDQKALASDIAGLDGALREEQANIGDELVALGYGRADADSYAYALTGIGNASAADNATEDATRATQWIQGLITSAQSGAAAVSGAGNQVSSNLSQSLSTLLTGIEFANIDSWRQLQYLIGSTINSTTSASSGIAGDSSAVAGNGSVVQAQA